jgi:hypothetical protein
MRRGMKFPAFSLLTVICSILSASALGAEFYSRDQGASMVMSGTIATGDTDRFNKYYSAACKRNKQCPVRIYLASRGGSQMESNWLAIAIQEREMDTVVGHMSPCYSACVLVFAVGKTRWLYSTATIGVHRSSVNGNEDYDWSLINTLNLQSVGVPPAILEKLMRTSAHDISLLSARDVKGWARIVEP